MGAERVDSGVHVAREAAKVPGSGAPPSDGGVGDGASDTEPVEVEVVLDYRISLIDNGAGGRPAFGAALARDVASAVGGSPGISAYLCLARWFINPNLPSCSPFAIWKVRGNVASAASDAAASDSCEPPCCAASALGHALTNLQTRCTCWVSEAVRLQRQAARAQRSAFFYSTEFAPGTFHSLAINRSGSWCEGWCEGCCSPPPRDARHALLSVAHLRGYQSKAATLYR